MEFSAFSHKAINRLRYDRKFDQEADENLSLNVSKLPLIEKKYLWWVKISKIFLDKNQHTVKSLVLICVYNMKVNFFQKK